MSVRGLVLAAGLVMSIAAQAGVFKCVGPDGRVIYTEQQDPRMRCTPVTGAVNVVPAPAVPPTPTAPVPAPAATPADLDQQIAATEQELAAARQALKEQEGIRLGSEANYQRVLDRLKPYQDKVAELEKRLEDLRAQKRRQ